MLHNAVVLYRRTITFSYIVSTNQSWLHIPTVGAAAAAAGANVDDDGEGNEEQVVGAVSLSGE